MKHKKKLKNAVQRVLLLSGLLLCISCGNLFEQKSSDSDINSNEKTFLAIRAGTETHSRTITPDLSLSNLQNFTLKGSRNDVEELNKTAVNIEDFEEQYELIPGTWTFTLSAESKDAANMGFSATVTTEIKRGIVNQVFFELKPIGTEGDFTITIDLSGNSKNEHSVDKVTVTLRDLSGTTIEIKDYNLPETPDNPSERIIAYSKTNFTPGTYHLAFDFYTGNDATPINQWEGYICVVAQTATTATISLNFNEVYSISYNEETGAPVDFSTTTIEDGFAITKYSNRSNFTLPVLKKSGKIFLGWKDSTSGNYISKITTGSTGNLYLIAVFTDPVLYVSASGNDNNNGFFQDSSLKTIEGACGKILEYGYPALDWKIKISGILKGGQNNDYAQCRLPETITTEYAKSIELTGATGLDANGISQDTLDRGSTYVSGQYETGSVVRVETAVPVTITNLQITRGVYSLGAGMFIAQGATVKLGDGVRIIGNSTGSSNGRGGGVHNEGTLFMYGTAAIGNKEAVTWAVGDSGSSHLYNYTTYPNLSVEDKKSKQLTSNYSGTGGGIYNGTGDTNNTVVAKVYLGYSGLDNEGNPIETPLTGGIYGNGASSGAGIYNQQNCIVYYSSGIIKYNTASSTGGGIYNYGTVEMSGGSIISNLAYYPSNSTFSAGGVYNGKYNTNADFIMSGGVINQNYATYGGGIYNTGNTYIYGTSVIGDNTATSYATTESCGNKAGEGGAIYNSSGNINIGYRKDGSIDSDFTENGGIYYNLATDIYHTRNYYGGAIYQSGSNGNGIIKIASGTIAYNSSDDVGGAIYISSSKNLEISGGIIRNNFATNGGGAICTTNKDALSLKGNPSIPVGADNKNDIYMKGTLSNITITGALDANSNAYYLTFSPYIRSDPVLVIGEGAGTTIADEYQKFEIAPYTITDQNGNQHNPHMILTNGILPAGCYLIEADTWEGDLARYIEAMTTSGTVRVGGAITRDLAQTVMTVLESKPSDFLLSLDLSKTTGWGDAMPSFEGCTRLKDFVFPNNLSVIRLNGQNTGDLFKNCNNLESITIPVSVKTIYDCFDDCNSLKDVYYMGSQSQKNQISFPTFTRNGVEYHETTLLSSSVTWHYLGYGYNITIDVGTDSDVEVSVTSDGSPVENIATINKGTPLTFTVNSSGYTTFKWKVDGTVQSETSSLDVDTSNWTIGATYTISLIAADDSGNEDSYFAQITVTE